MALLMCVITACFLAAGIWFYVDEPNGSFIANWNWYVSLFLGLLATGGLSLYFFLVSAEVPQQIHQGVSELVEQLRSTLQGYDAVTARIVDVCESAHGYYYAATLMPLVGAVGADRFYQAYRRALVDNINAGLSVQLVFLADQPLHGYMRSCLKDEALVNQRIELVGNFIDSSLRPHAQDPEFADRLLCLESDFIPYQICIADGERAVLYFGNALDLTRAGSVRAFYTEDRGMIEVLGMGFEEMRRHGTPRFDAARGASVISQVLEADSGPKADTHSANRFPTDRHRAE